MRENYEGFFLLNIRKSSRIVPTFFADFDVFRLFLCVMMHAIIILIECYQFYFVSANLHVFVYQIRELKIYKFRHVLTVYIHVPPLFPPTPTFNKIELLIE